MTEMEDNAPEWMIELKNRKRKPHLAHEAGAGSPCLSCKDACPGLDLHFWRKICKNCKCGRDEHDVADDEFPQFDLLFGRSGKPRRKATFLPVVIKTLAEKENAFEWIPPDVSTDIAVDYMKALPENKLPIKGSAGAALRKQQLQKQLPLHDVDHKACDKLSEDEKQQFEKYLENLKKYVGQGRVSKVIGARPFSRSLMTPANAADMQPMSPQRNPHTYVPTGEPTNLRTPSSFIPKGSGSPSVQGSQKQQNWLAANLEAMQAQISGNVTSTGVIMGQYHPALDSITATGRIANSEIVSSNRHPPQQFANTIQLTDTQQNIACFLPNPENASYLPDFSTVNYLVENSESGAHFQPTVPLDRDTSIAGSNTDSNVTSNGSSRMLQQQTASYENLSTPWNVSRSSAIPSSQYNEGNVSISRPSETTIQSGNTGILDPSFSVHLGHLARQRMQSQLDDLNSKDQTASVTNEVHDIPNLPQNISHSNDLSLQNAKLAEQMLSDALLPPSAVHINEIIGSTLDKNKLKYIQEKLSAKYSKDELPSLHTSASQRIETADPQFGQSIGKHRFPQNQSSSINKEADRAAIIAAMRNPSAFSAKNQQLDEIGGKHANPLDQSVNNRNPSTLEYRSEASSESRESHKADTLSNNSHHSIIPQDGRQVDVLMSPESNLSLEVARDGSGELKHSAAIPDRQQQQSLNSHYQTSRHPQTAVTSEQQGRASQNPADSDTKRNLRNTSLTSNPELLLPTEQLREELNYEPARSQVICSESLGNRSFPEAIIDSPGLRQNPVSVDQLQGALEELSVGPVQLQKCTQCKEEIRSGEVVVTAEKAKDAIWHPRCFICSTCNELLADLVYFYHKGRLYCGRDLVTLLNIPRCFACDELIFVREYTVAEGHNYHVKHFCCWDCDMPLAGQQYISENDRPLCLPCYQKTYAKTCKTCSRVIAADQQGVAVRNLDFHATDACFSCFTCKKSLLSGKMAIKQDRPFCSKECITGFLNTKS